MKKMSFKYCGILASIGLAALVCDPSVVLAQTAPSLGQAGSFAVLGGSAVTNTGATVIVGDLGIWPNTASSITGFPPGTVNGTTHAGDAVAMQAQSDLTTAYNNLAGQACNRDLTGTDLGGLTLTPGVYCFTSTAQLTGILTLDAQGNPNAVFIFKIGATLTTASASSVRVISGGSNCNVFWQVGSSATLGTGTAFVGNILALDSITATTGSSVSGRVLARNGAATLDTDSLAVCSSACTPITLSPTTLPNETAGTTYSQTITASGGTAPYVFSVVSGAPPTGLTLSTGGVLSGTPTTTGSFTFTVIATDSLGCSGEQIYTIVINAANCPAITISPATLPAAALNVRYSQTITASGGTAPYLFSVTSGSLPPGLNLSSSGSSSTLLSGTPTTPGSYTFTITATDASSCLASQIYTVTIVVNVGTAATPTLSQWGLILLAGLLALVGFLIVRKRGALNSR